MTFGNDGWAHPYGWIAPPPPPPPPLVEDLQPKKRRDREWDQPASDAVQQRSWSGVPLPPVAPALDAVQERRSIKRARMATSGLAAAAPEPVNPTSPSSSPSAPPTHADPTLQSMNALLRHLHEQRQAERDRQAQHESQQAMSAYAPINSLLRQLHHAKCSQHGKPVPEAEDDEDL
ncbi:hypothetical protein AMAG_09347 [Allomyces macrogynus ATCC 38327]|uniref:Uncharacterized protein n=1 Tax=Allomyces macrogynus (strain ATCC 38327) TaxID=578462 RepID=A0A0L0SPL6_ALLM3|nr:hypothetical protein AMAG_09347 [Allomyces macrogynus ATCC 38327]|eukprot:KNE64320.1 hypothetical protein AMAG_09347 [Allomyces macrogynus ATCC 38327]